MANKIGESRIGAESKVEMPKYADGLHCAYPAEQAKRPAPSTEIAAKVFREKDVRDKAKGGY